MKLSETVTNGKAAIMEKFTIRDLLTIATGIGMIVSYAAGYYTLKADVKYLSEQIIETTKHQYTSRDAEKDNALIIEKLSNLQKDNDRQQTEIDRIYSYNPRWNRGDPNDTRSR